MNALGYHLSLAFDATGLLAGVGVLVSVLSAHRAHRRLDVLEAEAAERAAERARMNEAAARHRATIVVAPIRTGRMR